MTFSTNCVAYRECVDDFLKMPLSSIGGLLEYVTCERV